MPKHPRSDFWNSHTRGLLRYLEHLLDRHNEIAAAAHPLTPTAKAIYANPNLSRIYNYDHSRRGATSPLGGQAVEKRK